ncbi:hypothetical protein H1R20_g13666, partial [Candolleomyces eurysporus]
MAASTSTSKLAAAEPTTRPKMRVVEKPPQGGRPKKARVQQLERIVDSFACEAEPIASGSSTTTTTVQRNTNTTTRVLRPLPCIPQPQIPQTAPPISCDPSRVVPTSTNSTTTSSTRPKTCVPKIRPLPPTPVPAPLTIRKRNVSARGRSSAPASLSPPVAEDSRPPLPPIPSTTNSATPQLPPPLPQQPPLLAPPPPAAPAASAAPLPSTSTSPHPPPSLPSPPSPPPPPREVTLQVGDGLGDIGDEKATELLEALKRDPNRHQQLILLAASLSRMCALPHHVDSDLVERDEGQESLEVRSAGSQQTSNNRRSEAPKLSLMPVLETVVEEERCNSSTLSSPVDFLNELGPSKRYTVLSILTTLTDEVLAAPDSESDSEEEEQGVLVQDGLRDPESKKSPGDISWEFAVKTGAAISAHAKILTKFSKKWVREKKGKRWVEDDYSNVLSFLRRL